MLKAPDLSLKWIPARWGWRWCRWAAVVAGASDTIDYSVGFTDMARLGDKVDGERPLAVIHAKDESSWQGSG